MRMSIGLRPAFIRFLVLACIGICLTPRPFAYRGTPCRYVKARDVIVLIEERFRPSQPTEAVSVCAPEAFHFLAVEYLASVAAYAEP